MAELFICEVKLRISFDGPLKRLDSLRKLSFLLEPLSFTIKLHSPSSHLLIG